MRVARAEKFKAESKALTVNVYVVEAVRDLAEYSFRVVVAMCLPSWRTLYPATETLSVEAFHESDAVVSVMSDEVKFVGADGATTSGMLFVVKETISGGDMFPTESFALIEKR